MYARIKYASLSTNCRETFLSVIHGFVQKARVFDSEKHFHPYNIFWNLGEVFPLLNPMPRSQILTQKIRPQSKYLLGSLKYTS
jgi:hypothetical protein